MHTESAGQGTVLVVDDDPDLCDIIASTLELDGFTVAAESEVTAAVLRARDERPEVVLFDLTMPVMDGAMLAERLRHELDPAPVLVAMSGRPAAATRCTEQELHVFMAKPFDAGTLRAVVLEGVRRARTGAARPSAARGCILALGAALRSEGFVAPTDFAAHSLVVMESEADALRLLDALRPKLVLLEQTTKSPSLASSAQKRGIELLSCRG